MPKEEETEEEAPVIDKSQFLIWEETEGVPEAIGHWFSWRRTQGEEESEENFGPYLTLAELLMDLHCMYYLESLA